MRFTMYPNNDFIDQVCTVLNLHLSYKIFNHSYLSLLLLTPINHSYLSLLLTMKAWLTKFQITPMISDNQYSFR